MFSNSNAYQVEVDHRRPQRREDLARRQQAKQVQLERRKRDR